MIEKIWFENHPLKYVLWPILWPLSILFRRISNSRRKAFESGSKQSYKAPIPLIVVGNITAGGNGKTPVVIWLVENLLKQGYKPGVVSRGYGAKAPHYPLKVEYNTSTAHCGDEPKLIFKRTGVPVAVDPVRANAVKRLLEEGVDVVITDDGLQHYALQRDIEFVVVDGKRRFGSQRSIPLGPMREPISRLQEVDFIITNGGNACSGEVSMSLEPKLAVNLLTGQTRPVKELENLVAFAGIGHPPRFFHTLETLGAQLVKTQGFADHQDFEKKELEELARQGSHVIMTEKDAVKCADFAHDNWWYLPVSAYIAPHEELRILNKINEVMEYYGSSST
ncbi:tetraacyldisaccharide 4'-kinase [Vibrio profundi]|uniref:tetraacyldisaccharide 4'-kinase n=1 Tax=Vibrio profundi TaxID=1774960 RepID=UPI003734EB15